MRQIVGKSQSWPPRDISYECHSIAQTLTNGATDYLHRRWWLRGRLSCAQIPGMTNREFWDLVHSAAIPQLELLEAVVCAAIHHAIDASRTACHILPKMSMDTER